MSGDGDSEDMVAPDYFDQISVGDGKWRVGRKIPLNVYAGDRPVCQCHSVHDAAMIVHAVNRMFEEARLTVSPSFITSAQCRCNLSVFANLPHDRTANCPPVGFGTFPITKEQG